MNIYNSIIKCCYKCPKRYVRYEDGKAITCHSTCEEYKKQKEQFEKVKEKEKMEYVFLNLNKRRRKL